MKDRSGVQVSRRRPRTSSVPSRRVPVGLSGASAAHSAPSSRARTERLRKALVQSPQVDRLTRTFRALGDPTRSRMVLALSLGELCVGDLAASLGATPSAISHQLRILRDLDIVRVRRSGKSQLYALNERAFGFCAPRLCQAWKQTLDRRTLVRMDDQS